MHKTHHMVYRMKSRGISPRTVKLALEEGEWNSRGDRLTISKNQLSKLIPNLRKLVDDLERLQRKGGVTVVIEDNVQITTYHNNQR